MAPAADGEEGLALFEKAPDAIRLVVTDVEMPKMNGIELATRLTQLRPGLPILLISGTRTAPESESPSWGFLAKPFLPSVFRDAINAMLERSDRPFQAKRSEDGRLRVVIADDDPDVRDRLRGLLLPEYDVVAATADGVTTIRAVEKLQPDLILLDISMPDCNGFAVARVLRSSTPQAPIVFVTQHPHLAYVEEAFRIGVAAYVLKHNAGEELRAALRQVRMGKQYLSPGLRLERTEYGRA